MAIMEDVSALAIKASSGVCDEAGAVAQEGSGDMASAATSPVAAEIVWHRRGTRPAVSPPNLPPPPSPAPVGRCGEADRQWADLCHAVPPSRRPLPFPPSLPPPPPYPLSP
ncbi:hypothetical protein I4F81_011632 [Pyropia yezoensis]|uniref:Uncharacterized protein n=1 Tax=Pyropia yezoensis TaxID=2788 RepID=A0ACC3CGT5_PYRYE|nr:hypothetical protein I4F81_011632 [Neopyropia yezoensis]